MVEVVAVDSDTFWYFFMPALLTAIILGVIALATA